MLQKDPKQRASCRELLRMPALRSTRAAMLARKRDVALSARAILMRFREHGRRAPVTRAHARAMASSAALSSVLHSARCSDPSLSFAGP